MLSKEYGITWNQAYGVLNLNDEVVIPSEIGEELAKDLFNKKVKNGHFKSILEDNLPKTMAYLNSTDVKKSININYKDVKDAFANYEEDNQRYKFTTNSMTFEIGINSYTYKGKEKKHEEELGNKIEHFLRSELKLDWISHNQLKREKKKYQNTDFEGFRIIRDFGPDRIEIVNIELKPSNDISYVSDAISQAINYKQYSNYTYIALPLFDLKNFYDPERYMSFYKMAEDNELGIISIDIDPNNNDIMGVNSILTPKKREIINNEQLTDIIEKSNTKYCPLCNHYILSTAKENSPEKDTSDEDITNCGCQVINDNEAVCMRQVMEKGMIKWYNM